MNGLHAPDLKAKEEVRQRWDWQHFPEGLPRTDSRPKGLDEKKTRRRDHREALVDDIPVAAIKGLGASGLRRTLRKSEEPPQGVRRMEPQLSK